MAQFTNAYNSQNGAMSNYQSQSDYQSQRQPNNWMYGTAQVQSNMQPSLPMPNQQPSSMPPAPWEQQGWKDISPETQSSKMGVVPIRGRFVTSIDDITPQDVPMDGSLSFFPTSDYSRIYAKVWGNDGRIRTFSFIPELEVSATNDKPNDNIDNYKEMMMVFTKSMYDRMDALESRIGDILTPFASQSKTPTKKTAKESEQS